MEKGFLKFTISFLFFVLPIAAVVFFLTKIIPTHTGSYTWVSLVYFFVITLVFHYGLLKSSAGRPQVFFRYFMSATTLKLMLHIMIIVGYSLTNKSNAVNFIINFFALYLLFTIYEVRQAMLVNKKTVS